MSKDQADLISHVTTSLKSSFSDFSKRVHICSHSHFCWHAQSCVKLLLKTADLR